MKSGYKRDTRDASAHPPFHRWWWNKLQTSLQGKIQRSSFPRNGDLRRTYVWRLQCSITNMYSRGAEPRSHRSIMSSKPFQYFFLTVCSTSISWNGNMRVVHCNRWIIITISNLLEPVCFSSPTWRSDTVRRAFSLHFSTFLKPGFAASDVDGTDESNLAESPLPLNYGKEAI